MEVSRRVQPNLGAHPGEVKQAPCLFVTTFDAFDFHGAYGCSPAGQKDQFWFEFGSAKGTAPNRRVATK
jgi:hypothetical protein